MWPFIRSEKIETRNSQPFTDAITQAIVAQAAGTIPSNPLTLGALEMACGAYQRAFMGASVEGSAMVKQAITSSILGLIARDLIRRGESIHLISVFAGQLELVPCGSWDVQGEVSEDSWEYRLDLFAPSGNITKLVSSSSVIHCRYSYDAARPWHGLGPLQHATSTATLASNLETRLGQETSGPVGSVIPIPKDSSPKQDGQGPLDALRRDISNLRGQSVFVETVNQGWGDGATGRPQKDWVAERIGANPPSTLQVLRSDVGRAVLGACGINAALFDATGSSQGQREAYRQFVNLSVMPLAKMVSEELSRKLETEVSLNFTELQAHDLAARASAFAKMVQGGMDLQKAVNLSGLMALEV